MTQYGIFNDEGLIEDGFYTSEEAQAVLEEQYEEDDAYVSVICHDHPDQEADSCEFCFCNDEEDFDDQD